jgi:starch synthase
LKDRCNDLYGILNGIDDEVYNPETDIHIPFKYNEKRFVSGKKENKQLLLKQLGLDQLVNIPLVCYIGRMVSQKGIDLMMATLEEAITATNANTLISGFLIALPISYMPPVIY